MKNIIIILFLFSIVFPQEYNGPQDEAGDPSAVKESRMDGNRILLYFKNTTQLSNWEPPNGLYDVSIWPNDGTGYRMLDGVALLVGGKTYIYNDGNEQTIDTIILDDLNDIEANLMSNSAHEVYFLQTNYREEMDKDELDLVKWGFYPAFGYMNSYQDYPAMSDDPNSWPQAWPSTGTMTKWPGEWDGRFGRGVQYADLETYFVVNDAQDQEYLQNKWECQFQNANINGSIYLTNEQCQEECSYFECNGNFYFGLENCLDFCEENICIQSIDDDYCYATEPFEYYPIENKFIQDDASVQPGLPWGGLGIRVEARAFQWNNPLVRDALFWEYNITNISDYDINEMAFGYWVDNAIGGEGGDSGDDEVGYFDVQLDLAYSWDHNATGFGGGTPGIMGFAFLESPGISNDGIDNDNDGLVDESRDNDAGALICATCGITNLELFLETYDLSEADLKEHYEGDEDQDWLAPVLDENNNCIALNDDLGLDGVGPNDINYSGPDEGECNGKPDCVEGVGCEPNFGETDVTESDMLGLTAFKLFPIDGHQEDSTTKWFKNDQIMWDSLMVIEDVANAFDQFEGTPSNMVEVFSSSVFPLYKGKTERISMAEIHSMDNIQGSPGGTEPEVPALFALKQTVQLIYETDYRFAVPPNIPTLTAEAGDQHVILTWDDIAESSIDRFLPDSLQYDFEGYKIYRSTDKYFKDAQIITDGYGNPMFFDPIFECDKIDSITGFADYATVFGAAYYLGDDTGIEHKYVDYDVENGRTYYYAVVAYDYGLEPNNQLESGIPPSENKALIQIDENEYVIGTGPNVAVVIPRDNSAGYISPWLDIDDRKLSGTGSIDVEVFSENLIQDGEDYLLTFDNDTDNFNYLSTSGFNIYKKDENCSYVDCSLINDESTCNNQYGCDWSEDVCVDYVCIDNTSQTFCNMLEECSWNNGIFDGEWNQSIYSDSLFLNDELYFSNAFAFLDDDLSLKVYDNESFNNDCFSFEFTLEETRSDTLKYNLMNISRYGNSVCEGNEISGYCNSDSYSLIDQNSCINQGEEWISYVEEYDILSLDFWYDESVSGGYNIIKSAFCDKGNFGNSFCSNFINIDGCNSEPACFWNKYSLIYTEKGSESPINFYQNHFEYIENTNPNYSYWTIDPNSVITTDAIDGLVFSISNIEEGSFKSSGWIDTDSYSNVIDPIIVINDRMSKINPAKAQIVFSNSEFQTREIFIFSSPQLGYQVLDEADQDIGINTNPNYFILNDGTGFSEVIETDFYVLNKVDNTYFDMLVVDLNSNNQYDPLEDKVLVGTTYIDETTGYEFWNGTQFSLSFLEYPEPGDIYSITYNSPFLSTDSLFIHANAPDSISIENHDIEIDDIKVVPNPYVGTNLMEEAFTNPNQSQERKIMFTHLPAQCEISIYTVSGILVDKIEVDNSFNDGMAYWDLLSNEGLEVAAGMYIYHVQSKLNNKHKLGKFAIIK